jgi:hypothetical protein
VLSNVFPLTLLFLRGKGEFLRGDFPFIPDDPSIAKEDGFIELDSFGDRYWKTVLRPLWSV